MSHHPRFDAAWHLIERLIVALVVGWLVGFFTVVVGASTSIAVGVAALVFLLTGKRRK